MQPSALGAEAFKVLSVVQEEPKDGYSILSQTGLSRDTLVQAALELQSLGLIMVKGGLSADAVGEAYFWVPPGTKGKVAYRLGIDSS